MKKHLLSASVVAAMTLMLGFSSCVNVPQGKTPVFSTVKTQRTTELRTWKYTAKLKGIQDVSILPRIAGNITKIAVTEGAIVKKGQTLFVIDQRPYELQVETAEANVLASKAQLSTAKLNLESNEGLYNKKIISRYAYETARNNFSNAEAALALAESQLENAKNDLGYCTVKSPVDGVVGVIPYRVGDLVSSVMAEPLTVVSDVAKVTAYFSITEGEYLALLKSMPDEKEFLERRMSNGLSFNIPAKLQMSDGSMYETEGKISSISGIVDELTGTFACKADFSNPLGKLRSGISASVVLETEQPNMLLVPQTAVNQLQNKSIVYVLQPDSTVKATVVEIEEMNDGKHYSITKGLTEGQEVVASGLNNITDGQKIVAGKE